MILFSGKNRNFSLKCWISIFGGQTTLGELIGVRGLGELINASRFH